MNYRAVALFGPTGVGKTALSLKLAEKNNAEIISVDSMQVYRYMDIGTAKILPNEQNGIVHHLIDVVNPDEPFTAGDFKRFSENKIIDIAKRGKTPFLVGGTGFYFSTLINGIVDIPKIDDNLRERLRKLLSKRGKQWIFRMLELVDYDLSLRLNENDSQRVLRGLEVFFGTNRKLSDFYNDKRNNLDNVSYLKIALNISRDELYDRINQRVDSMIQSGLENEVRKLLDMRYTRDDWGMKGIGYVEFIDYFEGKCSFSEAVDKIKQNSRHYAKRQLTWFRKMSDVHWFSPNDEGEIISLVNSFLS
ncbi:MAG: tRNA (adenosine(37)-N6)-dimethylallyltransferase MiaA [Spirochaetales bacterium]|nr:tRNA (adenosine(37)-N6)-dimethylallyltransferase MiaA [Spirochaetales bacterium]